MAEKNGVLKGRNQERCILSPFQVSDLHVCLSHRALPDAIAKRLAALLLVICFLFFSPKPIKA